MTSSPRASLDTVGIVTHPRRRCDDVVDAIVGWVSGHGGRIVTLDGTGAQLPSQAERLSSGDLAAAADLVIAAGGDGTILRALAVAAPAAVPVLGVNLGRLGFLAEVDPPELSRALAAIADGDYTVEARLALDCRIETDGPELAAQAFNDVVLFRSPGQGQAAAAVSVNGELFARYAADGVIVSTPTGSTAYTLSVGGPIVSPVANAILVTPLAPHGLFNRSLVIDPSERLEIHALEQGAPLVIEADGRRIGELAPGATVTVARSDRPGLLARLGWTSFYSRARRKLQMSDPLEISSESRREP